MQQETFDFVKGNPFEVTQDDMRKLDSYLSQFLENNQDELTPILTDREIQDINIFQESNISNLPIQEGSIISVFDELVKNSQDELNKKISDVVINSPRVSKWDFERMNKDLDSYLFALGKKQIQPETIKVKAEMLSKLEQMIAGLDLSSFQSQFLISLGNDYFGSFIYDTILPILTRQIPEERIRLETSLNSSEQGFLNSITKRDLFEESSREVYFSDIFIQSQKCKNQIISWTRELVNEKDYYVAAVFLTNYYFDMQENHGVKFSEEEISEFSQLQKRYKEELFPSLFSEFVNEYKYKCLKELREKERKVRSIGDTKSLAKRYHYDDFIFFHKDLWFYQMATGRDRDNSEEESQEIRKIRYQFIQRLKDIEQARINQLKRIESLGPRIKNAQINQNGTLRIEPEVVKPKLNLEELLSTVSYNLEIKGEDQVGKLILTYDLNSNSFHLITRGIKEEGFYFTVNKDPKIFRKFVASESFSEIYGLHKSIRELVPERRILGGGAYFTQANKIHIDYKSVDYGKMNLELVKICLQNSGYDLSILDEEYFDTSSAIFRLEFLNH